RPRALHLPERQGHALSPPRLARMVVDRQIRLVGLRAPHQSGHHRPLRPRAREDAHPRDVRPAGRLTGAAGFPAGRQIRRTLPGYRRRRLPSTPRTISRPSVVPIVRIRLLKPASAAVSRREVLLLLRVEVLEELLPPPKSGKVHRPALP